MKAVAAATNPVRLLPSRRAVAALPTVARLRSLSPEQETTYTLKVSYNRGGQTMICRLAVAAGSTDCDDGLAKAAQIWRRAGLDTDDAVLIDGSGLPGNLITVDNQVQLQTIMARPRGCGRVAEDPAGHGRRWIVSPRAGGRSGHGQDLRQDRDARGR